MTVITDSNFYQKSKYNKISSFKKWALQILNLLVNGVPIAFWHLPNKRIRILSLILCNPGNFEYIKIDDK